MNKTTKRTIAKYGSLAVALTLATTLGASSLTAFAANDKARTDDVTSEYESFNEDTSGADRRAPRARG